MLFKVSLYLYFVKDNSFSNSLISISLLSFIFNKFYDSFSSLKLIFFKVLFSSIDLLFSFFKFSNSFFKNYKLVSFSSFNNLCSLFKL
jgi:hypothetical protein